MPDAFRDLFVSSRYKAFYGGRGGAKTHSFATVLVLAATSSPIRILCCREIQRSIRESVKYAIEAKIVECGLQDRFVATGHEIRGSNGSQFIFEGLRSNVLSLQSMAGIDRVWVEEGQSISQNSLDVLIPTVRKPGSELWFSWNPRSPKDPVDRMFRSDRVQYDDVPEPYEWWEIVHNVGHKDNPWFPEVLRAEMERDKRRDPGRYAHIWLGEYQTRSDAAVFKNWKIGTLEVPEDMVPYFGADWGFSVDPTVLVRCYVFEHLRVLYVDAEVSEVGCPIDKTPALFDQLDGGMARYWPIRADSSRPETIQYMETHGYRKIIPARKGPGSVEEGVQFLQNFDIVVHPNCKRVIDELTLYSYEIDKLTNDVLPKLADEDNHTIDALRYAVEDVRRATRVVKPIVVTSPLSINYG